MRSTLPQVETVLAVVLSVLMVLSISVGLVGAAAAAPDDGSSLGEDSTTAADASNESSTETSSDSDASGLATAESALADAPGNTTLARDQLALVGEIHDIESSTSGTDEALAIAEAVLAQRQQWAASPDKPLPASMVPQFEVARTKLDASRKLLETDENYESSDSLSAAVAKAKQGTKMQAAMGNEDLTVDSELPDVETPNHESPSAAVLAIMDRYGVTPTAEDRAELQALDDLPDRTRTALTDFLDAYLAFQRNTAEDDVTGTFAARNQLLDETVSLNDALQDADTNTPGVASPQADHGDNRIGCVDESAPSNTNPSDPTFCVLIYDDTGSGNSYNTNSVLLVDTGGSDHYDMNAGGTNLDDDCNGITNDISTSQSHLDPEPPTTDTGVATALVDYGSRSDNYTRTKAIGCGQRGGALMGSGFLLDAGGADEYGNATNRDPANSATNGGAESSLFSAGGGAGFFGAQPAHGFLLDAGGNTNKDEFIAGSQGTNGGAVNSHALAYGFLMNTNGQADYSARAVGVNGGSEDRGNGFLADLGSSDDTYDTEAKGTNGGGIYQSKYGGFLLDAGGADTYTATSQGTNGGGTQQGSGFLLDNGAGSDDFITGHENQTDRFTAPIFSFETGNVSRQQGFQGVNGGGHENGVGVLINADSARDDLYKAGDGQGANGGAFQEAAGLLVDTGGSSTGPNVAGGDNYTAGYDPTAGSEWNNPKYNPFPGVPEVRKPSAGTNGGGTSKGVGALVDTENRTVGKDTLLALDGHFGGVNGTNGGGWSFGTGGVGLLANSGGEKDTYKVLATDGPISGANGGGSGYGQHSVTGAHNPAFEERNFPALRATGTLADMDGASDEYIVNATNNDTIDNETVAGVNGGAFGPTSVGLLIDTNISADSPGSSGASDEDTYEVNATNNTNTSGVNGGVDVGPITLHVNETAGNRTIGVNRTVQNPAGENKTVNESERIPKIKEIDQRHRIDQLSEGAFGLLLDTGGIKDTYKQDTCGPVKDDTWLTKGLAGAQIDLEPVNATGDTLTACQ